MPRECSRFKVDTEASTDDHYHGICSRGQQYVAQACRQNLPGPSRQRIIQAALTYLETRSRDRSSSSLPSQSSSQNPQFSQGATGSVPTRDATFQSYLAGLIDADIPPYTLVNACVKSADIHLLPVLVKCLGVLAQIGHIKELKSVGGDIIISQSQYQDHELLSQAEVKNVDPHQRPCIQTALPENPDNAPEKIAIRRTGQNFVDEFVSKLVDTPIGSRPSQTRSGNVFIVSVARESPLSSHAVERVLHILISRMHLVEIFELPAYIYQLLLFASTKGKEFAKSCVLLRIAEVFAEYEHNILKSEAMSQSMRDNDEDAIVADELSLKTLREVEGTALYHIDVATRQDPSLATEIVKLTKSGVENPRHFLSSFGTGIVLLLSRSAFLRKDVLPLLREAIARFGKERSFRSDNIFAGRVAMNDDKLPDPRDSLLKIAESTCESGWDFVKEGLLELSFVLLDKPLPLLRPTHRQSLGMELISKLFNSHPVMRPVILKHLHFRIALQEKSAFHAIRIIKSLIDNYPYCMLEHQSFIRDCIELLVTLPQWLASPLMNAFKPFFELRQDLLDFFYLVVRKSLFYKESSTRAMAISGFLTVASVFRGTGVSNRSMSQATSQRDLSQRADTSIINAIIETIQPLRRVFSFPGVMRAFMYKTVVTYIHEAASANAVVPIASALGSVLLSHVHRFVNVEKAPYLLLDLCVNEAGGGALQEPLGELLWCLAVLESKRAPEEYHKSYITDLAKKVASVSFQDFPVSKAPLSSPEDEIEGLTQSGQAAALANRNKVRVLGASVEALIHATLISPQQHFDWKLVSEVVVPLLLLKGKVFDSLRSVGASSPSDAFRDLGGDLELERLRPLARLMFNRSAKASSLKKGGGARKGKSDQSSGQGTSQNLGCRAGSFSVLVSAHMKPSLSLQSCLNVLQMMAEAAGESQDDGNPFSGQVDSQDFHDLRVYLLVVAHKHVDEFVQMMSKWSLEEPERSHKDVMEMVTAVETLVRMAMYDFKRFRRASGEVAGRGGLKALQIGESCAAALPYLCQYDDVVIASFCKALLPAAANSVFNDNESTCETAVDALEKLVESLLGELLAKEAIVVLHIHDHLVQCIVMSSGTVEKKAKCLSKRAQWAIEMVSSRTIRDASIVKTLVHMCLVYIENNNDLRLGEEICERLLQIIGGCDTAAEPPEVNEADNGRVKNALAIQQDTCLSTVDAVCDVVERGITDVEWCLGRMISLEAVLESHFSTNLVSNATGKEVSDHEKKLHDKTAKLAIRAEDAAQTRLAGVIQALRGLYRCAIAKWGQQERLLKLATKSFKLLSTATQAQTKRRGDPRTSFIALITEGKLLSPTLAASYMFLEANAMNDGGGASASRAKTEGRMKAQLVYDEERFYQLLIAAQKRTKINLLRGMRRSTARDFRIREDKLRYDEDGGEDSGDREQGGETEGRGSDQERDANRGNNGRSMKSKKRRVT